MANGSVLIVDPDDCPDELVAGLREHKLTVSTANSATRALALIGTDHFDCLATTYRLPGDDGVELVRAATEIDPQLSTVIYADVNNGGLAVDAFEAGADRFVRKKADGWIPRLLEDVLAVCRSSEEGDWKVDIAGHEPEANTVVRTLDNASVGVSITDPDLPDNPIVYVNDTWESITGYDRDEVLGRNPRMLQGPGTDPETIEAIRNAIERQTSITVELRNYRPDGTPFWNELTLAPIKDETGELVHFVGFQKDVTDRKQAEHLTDEQARALRDEREAFSQLIDRVTGVFQTSLECLLTETDPIVLRQRICDHLVGEGGYRASWIIEEENTDSSVVPRARAGILFDNNELQFEDFPSGVAKSLETNQVMTESIGSKPAAPYGPARVGARRFAAVPLNYQESRFGVLGVYAQDSQRIDDQESAILATLGHLIAARLHALTQGEKADTKRYRLSLADPDESLRAIAAAISGEVESMTVMNHDSEGLVLSLRTNEAVDNHNNLDVISTDESSTARNSYDLRLHSDTDLAIFRELDELDISVERIVDTLDHVAITVAMGSELSAEAVRTRLNNEFTSIELYPLTEGNSHRSHDIVADIDASLTERQRAALSAAYRQGYFEWPRPTDGSEIAKTMGITRQTYHQHLRAAQRKLVNGYMDAKTPTPMTTTEDARKPESVASR